MQNRKNISSASPTGHQAGLLREPQKSCKERAKEEKTIPAEDDFNSPRRSHLSLKEVIRDIGDYIQENPRMRYAIIIGSDSQGRVIIDCVTAIVVHRVGNGGRYYWQRQHRGPIHSLREKIYTETALSLEVAERFIKLLKKELAAHAEIMYHFEIHVDAGENGPSRDVLKEVVGMVRGYGFDVRIKPESYCASCVADRHV